MKAGRREGESTDATFRASELDLRLIVDSIPGFVWTMTGSGDVDLVNQQMVDYFGAGAEELNMTTSAFEVPVPHQ